MKRQWKHQAVDSLALLAQLVARGSDKAKVIGSSPVESNNIILLPLLAFVSKRFELAHFFTLPLTHLTVTRRTQSRGEHSSGRDCQRRPWLPSSSVSTNNLNRHVTDMEHKCETSLSFIEITQSLID